jgi:hypothetical protein
MANPAIISKNTNYTAGNGQVGNDSGNIVVQTTAGKPTTKLADGTQQSATTLASSQDAGYAGSYLEGSNQNNEMAATITNIALTSNVVTVTCTNLFYVGQNIELNGLTTNTVLNRVNLVISTCSGSSFTAAFTYGNIVSGSDTGTATYTNSPRGAGLSLNAGRQ